MEYFEKSNEFAHKGTKGYFERFKLRSWIKSIYQQAM